MASDLRNKIRRALEEALEPVVVVLDRANQTVVGAHALEIKRLTAERDNAREDAERAITELRRFRCPGVLRVEQEKREGAIYVLPLLSIYPSPKGLIIHVGEA